MDGHGRNSHSSHGKKQSHPLWKWGRSPQFGVNRSKDLGFFVGDANAPVPPPYPVPKCEHGLDCFVRQSRHPLTAARAYFCCSKEDARERCGFGQWIDGPEMCDQRFIQYPNTRYRATPYEHFERWVPPAPIETSISDEEKLEAAERRVRDPPLCKCGYRAELVRPPVESRHDSFFRCPILLMGNKRGCDFLEWSYGPLSKYPEETGPTVPRCQCGVLARVGVVPSELGYGYYCGMTVGENDMWHTRQCEWENFRGRDEFLEKIRSYPSGRQRELLWEKRQEIRKQYFDCLTTPPMWILNTIGHEVDLSTTDRDKCLKYWRVNRDKYPPPDCWDTIQKEFEKLGMITEVCFGSRFKNANELCGWVNDRLKLLKNPAYIAEQQRKNEEAERIQKEVDYKFYLQITGQWKDHLQMIEENAKEGNDEWEEFLTQEQEQLDAICRAKDKGKMVVNESVSKSKNVVAGRTVAQAPFRIRTPREQPVSDTDSD